MQDTISDLAEQGLALLPEDRARLAELLLASLCEPPAPEIDAAWNDEVARRLAAYDRGDVMAIPAADVFAKARKIAR